MFPEVDTHPLKSISGQKRYQTGVLLLELISDIFERFSHGVFDHLLLCFSHLLESFVEVVKDLIQERRSIAFNLLPYHRQTIFV